MAERGGGGQIYPFLKNSLGFFPEKVRKGEGNTDVRNTVGGGGPPARPPYQASSPQPGTGPDRESNLQPLNTWDDAQSSEQHRLE